MKTWFFLIHVLSAVPSHRFSIQSVNPFPLVIYQCAVVALELLDLEARFWYIQNLLDIQRAACDAVGIGIMVLGNPMVIPAGRDEDLAGELYLQLLQECGMIWLITDSAWYFLF